MFRHDILDLKANINNRIGQKIIVKGSLGRGKEFAKEGTVENTYNNHFIIKYDDNDRIASYTYQDVIMRAVEVDVFDGEEFNSLMPPLVIESKRRRIKEQTV